MTDKILSLTVRGKFVSNHGFGRGGLIEQLHPALGHIGSIVTPYDLRGDLYPNLNERTVDGGGNETGALIYDSSKLRLLLTPLAIAVLSNESEAISLDQAIVRRQNQFLSRYKHLAAMATSVANAYPLKVNKLNDLMQLFDQRFTQLDDAYVASLPQGANPLSDVRSPHTIMSTSVTGIGSIQDHVVKVYNGEPAANATADQTQVTTLSLSRLASYNGGNWVPVTSPTAQTLSQQTDMVSQTDELKHPYLENRIRHQKLTADLIDEILAQSVFSLRVPFLQQIWSNELADIDLEIRRLQVAFIETFLIPRSSGVITGINKIPGDLVRAGDPVARIENDDVILLVGQVKRAGPISRGHMVTLTSAATFEESPAVPLRLTGTVVATNGYAGETDKWNVAIECKNITPKIPIGYDFESDSRFTTLTFS